MQQKITITQVMTNFSITSETVGKILIGLYLSIEKGSPSLNIGTYLKKG